jgi:hypothetical protein
VYISSPNTVLTVSGSSIISTIALPASTGTQTFTANGGYHVGVTTPWSISSHGSSGSTLNTSTGVYAAGAAGVDVLHYTDALGNIGAVTVTVS